MHSIFQSGWSLFYNFNVISINSVYFIIKNVNTKSIKTSNNNNVIIFVFASITTTPKCDGGWSKNFFKKLEFVRIYCLYEEINTKAVGKLNKLIV